MVEVRGASCAARFLRPASSFTHTLEGFDWEAPVSFDRDRVRDLFTLSFVERQEDVTFLGPGGGAPRS